jgi:REP element-mobilizing transposase RayT
MRFLRGDVLREMLNMKELPKRKGRAMFRGDRRALRAPTVSTVINQFKGYVTKQTGFSPWQRSFYDHVIRDRNDYIRVANYIENNPMNWSEDEYNQRFFK